MKVPHTPIKTDSRICFGIAYFGTEQAADEYGAYITNRGDTYNGGFGHGLATGRDKGFDYFDVTLGYKLFAVTTA